MTRHTLILATLMATTASLAAEPEIRTAIHPAEITESINSEDAQATAPPAASTTPKARVVPAPDVARQRALVQAVHDRFVRDAAPSVVTRRPDNTLHATSSLRDANFRMAHIAADGSLELVCTHGAEEAVKYLQSKVGDNSQVAK